MDELPAHRALSFGSVAASYALHRPGYPDEAVAWALESLPISARVLDLAAGTGKLTEAILRCGIPAAAVLAVEPDAEMRAELGRRLPQIAVRPGSAEQVPAADGVSRTCPNTRHLASRSSVGFAGAGHVRSIR